MTRKPSTHRVDLNHAAIVKGLREAGYSVQSLSSVGGGCPDILVGADGMSNILLEIKSEQGQLTKAQEAWLWAWKGQAAVVRSLDEALEIVQDGAGWGRRKGY